MNRAYKAIKAANANLTVIGLGAGPRDDFTMMSAGAKADGFAFHPYQQKIPEQVGYGSSSFVSFVKDWRMHTSLPIWHTEYGVSTVTAADKSYKIGQLEQAMDIARRMLLSTWLKIERSTTALAR